MAYFGDDGSWIVSDPNMMNDKAMLALIEAQFDSECEIADIAARKAQREQKEMESAARLIAIIRTASFLTDIAVITALLPWKSVKRRLRLQRDMIKYLFKRIDYKEMLKSIRDNG